MELNSTKPTNETVVNKLSFGQIERLLEEYAANSISIHILNDQETWLVEITKQSLSIRQNEIRKMIMTACGLEYGDKQ